MPVMIDSIFYELALHDKDFAAALRKSVANLDGLDQGAKKAAAGVGHLENGITSLTSDLKRLAGGFAIGWAAKAFIQNTVDAQRALAQLGAALRSTGGAAGFTLPELVKMSEEMSKLSTFSNEAVQGGLSRLLTYTGLQGPMFKEAARATLDFATALGIDTTSAAERVGNALQYPTEAINSLTKQGFRFTAEQKRLIKGFEDTGQLAKAQAIILGELDLAYKGSAEAARGTLGGALTGLKNDFMTTLEVSKESAGGIIEAINSIGGAMPGLRTAFNATFRELDLMFLDAAIAWQKFSNLFRKDKDKISNEDLTRLRNDRFLELTGLGAMLDQANAPAGSPGKPGGTTPRGLTDAQIAAQKAARAGFESALAGQTTGGADNFEAQVTKLVAAAQKAHLGATEIAKMVAELRSAHAKALAEDSAKLATDLQGQLASLTATMADDLKQQLAEFDRAIGEAKKKGLTVDPALVESLRAAKQQAIELAPKTEEIAVALERIDQATSQGFNLSGSLDEMNTLIDKATAIRDATPVGSAARVAAQERLNALIAKEAEIRKKLRDIMLLTANESTKLAANVEDVAGGIANAANAAFGLASAFLGVNSNITKALGSIGQLAGGISSVSGLATQAGGFGKLFSTGSGIASALPGIGQAIGGALALAGSLFGKDPQIEAARQETLAGMKQLRSALIDLKDVYLQTVSSVSLAADIENTKKLLAGVGSAQGLYGPVMTFGGQRVLGSGEGNGPGRRGNLRAIGSSIGQDFDSGALLAYFRQLDARYGTNLASFIEREDPYGLLQALRDVPAALQGELGELGRFADDAAGTIAKVNYGLDLLGKSGAADRFRAVVKGLLDAGINLGEFGAALKELADPATTAARVNEIVESVLQRINAGGADFGALTPEQLRDLFKQGVDAARGGTSGTGGFNVSRTITEVTGNRLEALLSTGNIFAEQTARNTGLIAQLLGGTSLPMINAPSLATSSFGASAGPQVVIESLTVQLSGLTDPARAQEIGARVGTSVLEEIDRGLGKRLQFAKLSRGIVS